jgi:hypothetical protein
MKNFGLNSKSILKQHIGKEVLFVDYHMLKKYYHILLEEEY